MDYIVLDIEFNGRKFASDLPMEVIEIGAVRLDASLNVVDEFTDFIKPVYFAKLNSFIQKKTGIPQESIDAAAGFPKVIRAFLAWLGKCEQPLLIAWGGEDLKRIVLDTRMHKMDDAYWLAIPCFDLLKGFLRVRGLTNDVSVEAALTDLGLSSEGSAHRALDDARMTADIFRKVYGQLDFSFVTHYKDQFTNAKERRLVKNAIRLLRSQKLEPTWESFAEHVLKDKVKLDDPRKEAELKSYFQAELEKKSAKPAHAGPKAKKDDRQEDGAADPASVQTTGIAGVTPNGREDDAREADGLQEQE
ncbi:3'-5' exonuclease [Paenibacillus soyae]|uniref:Exonuclease domain-containing protein n=1 Tax=Paenibacillus soyae TaxID=2969249 RepID=A0A9X2SAS6_9BACL|nr:3'-5' exonuclease [Paenibacillus soyae]MCR2807019.1 exonuclease domain-containing protein [Paenibacillus soyae]